jgi:cobalt-zinc-cadmium resistance protein CzcA
VRGLGLVSNAADIGTIVVAERNGAPIYVRDVAEVKEAPGRALRRGHADGKEVVLGIALARINENAKTVVEAVKEKLAIAQAALPKGVELKPVYDRTEIVDKALKTADQRADRRLDPGRGDPVPVSRRVPLGHRRDRHACRWRC